MFFQLNRKGGRRKAACDMSQKSKPKEQPSSESMYALFRTLEKAEARNTKQKGSAKQRHTESAPRRTAGIPNIQERNTTAASAAHNYNHMVKSMAVEPHSNNNTPARYRNMQLHKTPVPGSKKLLMGYDREGFPIYMYGTPLPRRRAVRVPKPTIKTYKNPSTRPFPTAIVFGSLICTILVMFIVYNYVKLNEYTSEVSTLNNQLAALKQTETDLNNELVKRVDLMEIERIAKDDYGMIKNDHLTKKYITIENEDKTEVVTDEPEISGSSYTTLMSIIADLFSEFFQ